MRILLDSCMSDKTRDRLVAAGFDVVWSGDWSSDPGDDEPLAYALRENRILITLDKDFGELIVLKRRPHRGVARLVGFGASEQADICFEALQRYRQDLLADALVTVERGRVRIRPIDVKE